MTRMNKIDDVYTPVKVVAKVKPKKTRLKQPNVQLISLVIKLVILFALSIVMMGGL